MTDYSELTRVLVPTLSAWFPSFTASRDLGRGTSNPTSGPDGGALAAGDRCFRSDLDWTLVYDGFEWVTAHEYAVTVPFADYSATDSAASFVRVREDFDPLVTRVALTTRVSATNNLANYWSVTLEFRNLDLSGGPTIIVFNTDGDTVGAYTDHADTSGLSDSKPHIALAITKNGAPGVLRVAWQCNYRLVVP